MSESESEISDFSQTLSKPTTIEEMEEEDDNVQVIFSQIEPYQDEPLAGGIMVSLVGTASFFRHQFILTAWASMLLSTARFFS